MDEILYLYDEEKLRKLARASSRSIHEIAKGLSTALLEAGPSHLTELADALAPPGNPLLAPDVRAAWEALGQFRSHLTEFLDGKGAVFVGGLAVCSYGGRARPSSDFDLVIPPRFVKEMEGFLGKEGGGLTNSSDTVRTYEIVSANTQCELLLTDVPLYREAHDTAIDAMYCDAALRVAIPGPLAAMKVKAFRDRRKSTKGRQDRDDVIGLVSCGATPRREIEAVLGKCANDLLPVLSEILS